MFLLAESLGVTLLQVTFTLLAIAGAIFWYTDRRDSKAKATKLEDRVRAKGAVSTRLGNLVLYSEPPQLVVLDPQQASTRGWPITGGITASVETAGSISVTRGRDLAAKAVGGALVPGGVFLFGNAKDTAHDHRELYLIVEGPDWAHTQALDPNAGAEARRFAQAINLASRKRQAPRPAGHPVETKAAARKTDTIDRLERLAKLRDSGALTPEEFEASKRAVLEPDA